MLSLRRWHSLLVLPFVWAAEASAAGFTDAQYATHIGALKKLPGKEFSIVLEKPFVVVGDLPTADLRKRCAAGTVRWHGGQAQGGVFQEGPDSYSRHLAVQGQGQLRAALEAAVGQ